MRRKVDHRVNLETKKEKELRCQYCARNTPKRIVVKKNPIQNITEELPELYIEEGYEEFLCSNAIRLRGKNGKWSDETCENHMIRKLKVRGESNG